MDNLAPEVKNKAEQNGFRIHTQTVLTSPHDQVNLIQTGYEAASLAEKELTENRTFIRNGLPSAHGFLTITGLPPGLPPTRSFYPLVAQSFTSPAETVMQDRHQPSCAGCSDLSHMYYDKRSKTITCPKKDIPEVRARADAWLKDFRERAKQRRHQKSRSTKAFISKIISQMTMSTNHEGRLLPTTTDAVILINTIVLAAFGNLPPLPIQIYPSLPHLELKLGTAESDFQPSISAIIDSGSCLCTGNWDYVMGITKAYPQLVKSITLSKNRYAPIALSGVVSDDETAHAYSTDLPCVVEFHMTYVTIGGAPTSLKIAIGKEVDVNVLIGMSFMTAAKLIVDLNDNVVESKLLSCKPFPIVYKRPQKSKPNLVPVTGNQSKKSLVVINAIEQAEAFISASTAAKAPILSPSKVTFDPIIRSKGTSSNQIAVLE
jgi:hypothetical protein